MKKIILMLTLFALIVGAGVLDVYYTKTFYGSTLTNLAAADISIQQNKENLNNPETMMLCQIANDDWEKGKERLMMVVNHNVVRYVDEKFVALLEQVKDNNNDDALVTVKVIQSYIKDLKEENYPYLRNIL